MTMIGRGVILLVLDGMKKSGSSQKSVHEQELAEAERGQSNRGLLPVSTDGGNEK